MSEITNQMERINLNNNTTTTNQPQSPNTPNSAISTTQISKAFELEVWQTQIAAQIEFYFSDDNLSTDNFLLTEMAKGGGYIDISVIANFNKMKTLLNRLSKIQQKQAQAEGSPPKRDEDNIEFIADSISSFSRMLQVSEDGTKVCRKTPLPELALSNLKTIKDLIEEEGKLPCIVVAENIPSGSTEESLAFHFSKVGIVVAVKITTDTNHHNTAEKVAFIEYTKEEAAKKACKELTDKNDWRKGLTVKMKEAWLKFKDQSVDKDPNKKQAPKNNNNNNNKKSANNNGMGNGNGNANAAKRKNKTNTSNPNNSNNTTPMAHGSVPMYAVGVDPLGLPYTTPNLYTHSPVHPTVMGAYIMTPGGVEVVPVVSPNYLTSPMLISPTSIQTNNSTTANMNGRGVPQNSQRKNSANVNVNANSSSATLDSNPSLSNNVNLSGYKSAGPRGPDGTRGFHPSAGRGVPLKKVNL